jgi:hypothetical protein
MDILIATYRASLLQHETTLVMTADVQRRDAMEAVIRAEQEADAADAKERELVHIILPWMESAYAFLQEHSTKASYSLYIVIVIAIPSLSFEL